MAVVFTSEQETKCSISGVVFVFALVVPTALSSDARAEFQQFYAVTPPCRMCTCADDGCDDMLAKLRGTILVAPDVHSFHCGAHLAPAPAGVDGHTSCSVQASFTVASTQNTTASPMETDIQV